MDMDSTAIQIECIDEIAKLAGTGEKVAEVTERAMRGELDFTASLRSRVATLKGADADILRQVRGNLPLMPGLTQLVLKLEALGWKIAIASGGFTFFADYLRDQLRLTAAVANELEIMDVNLPVTLSAILWMLSIKPIPCFVWRKSMTSRWRRRWRLVTALTICQ